MGTNKEKKKHNQHNKSSQVAPEQVDLQDCDAALRKWESIKSWISKAEINTAASDNKRGDKTNDWQEWLDKKDSGNSSGLDWNWKTTTLKETQGEL